MGAWIEIILEKLPENTTQESRPSWARGLKLLLDIIQDDDIDKSRPSWARGLKYLKSFLLLFCRACRAPHGRVD